MLNPYVYWFQEHFCCWVLYFLLGRIRPGRNARFWISWGLWTVINISMLSGCWDEINLWAGVDLVKTLRIAFLFAFILISGTAYEGGWIKMLMVVFISDLYMMTLLGITAGGYALFSGSSPAAVFSDETLIYGTPMSMIRILLFIALAFLGRDLWRRIRDIPVVSGGWARWIGILFYIILTSSAAYQIYLPSVRRGEYLVLALSFLMEAAFILLMIYYLYSEYMREQNQVLLRQIHMMQEYRGVLDEQQEMARKLRHDIRRHMDTLAWAAEIKDMSSSDRERLHSYRERMQKMAEELQMGNYSGDPHVDAMIYPLEAYCRRNGIPWGCRLRQIDVSAIPEGTRRDLVFEITWWAMGYLSERRTDRGMTVRGSAPSRGAAENVRVCLEGVCVSGRNCLKVKIHGVYSRSARDRGIVERVQKELRHSGIDGSAEIRSEPDGIAFQIEW